jgi:uncharacterized membrane protein (UPF0127 family)
MHHPLLRELKATIRLLLNRAKRRWADWRIRAIIIGLAALLLALFIVHRFSPKSTQLDCAFQISDNLPVIKGDAFKVDTCVNLEAATTNSERTLGLSGRKSMPTEQGMLFDFHVSREYCMWMKDMNFALDMMWLNEKKEIVYMIENVTPDTYPKAFCGPKTARYVVEVNTGVVKAGGLRVGQRLRF